MGKDRFGISLIRGNVALRSIWRLMKHCWNGIAKGKLVQCFDFMNGSQQRCRLVIFKVLKKKLIWMQVKKHGLGFVRRPTGGRGVLHEHELTYSVIVSEELSGYA